MNDLIDVLYFQTEIKKEDKKRQMKLSSPIEIIYVPSVSENEIITRDPSDGIGLNRDFILVTVAKSLKYGDDPKNIDFDISKLKQIRYKQSTIEEIISKLKMSERGEKDKQYISDRFNEICSA